MLFYQAAAPTGWTQVTSVNDRALRVVSGTGAGTGGSIDFSTLFNGSYQSGSTAITEAQMPSHTHGVNDPGHAHNIRYIDTLGGPDLGWQGIIGNIGGVESFGALTGIYLSYTGGGNGHTHTIPSLQYADVIICTKS